MKQNKRKTVENSGNSKKTAKKNNEKKPKPVTTEEVDENEIDELISTPKQKCIKKPSEKKFKEQEHVDKPIEEAKKASKPAKSSEKKQKNEKEIVLSSPMKQESDSKKSLNETEEKYFKLLMQYEALEKIGIKEAVKNYDDYKRTSEKRFQGKLSSLLKIQNTKRSSKSCKNNSAILKRSLKFNPMKWMKLKNN